MTCEECDRIRQYQADLNQMLHILSHSAWLRLAVETVGPRKYRTWYNKHMKESHSDY